MTLILQYDMGAFVWPVVLVLLPVAWIIDGVGVDAEPSAEGFEQRFGSFFLAVGRVGGFGVGYDADSYGLSGAVPGSPWYD